MSAFGKSGYIRGVWLLPILVVTMFSAGPGQAAGHSRMPPGVQVYEEGSAVIEAGTGIHEDSHGGMTAIDNITIYTKSDVRSVSGFYRQLLGINPSMKSYGQSFYLGMDVNDSGSYSVPVNIEIFEASKRKRKSIEEERLFSGMEDDMLNSQMAGTSKHSSADLNKLKQRYLFLTKRWYPGFDVDEKLHGCKNMRSQNMEGIESARDPDAMAAQIQQLVAQGKFDEATQMAQAGAQSGMAEQNESMRDNWDDWVGCLDDIDSHSYRTKIMIWKVSDRFRPAAKEGR